MKKKNVIICFNPRNAKGNTVIPPSVVREFAYRGESCKPSQVKNHYGMVTIKDLGRYRHFFEQYHVPMELVHRMLSEYQAQIRVKEQSISVVCKSDRWRISFIEKDQVQLEHNNYKLGQYGGRCFSTKYHTQRISTLEDALKYIMKYDYKKMHFSKKGIQKELKKALEDSLTSRYEAVFESKEKVKKKHIIKA